MFNKKTKTTLLKGVASVFICLSVFTAKTTAQCSAPGWASSGTTTGAGNVPPASATIANSYTSLKNALNNPNVKLIHVSDVISFPVDSGRIVVRGVSGKTIFGLPGSKLVGIARNKLMSGLLQFSSCSNIILRNLTFIGAGAFDVDGYDNLHLKGSKNIWVDQCDFQDGVDGNFDITNQSDLVTVSWCKFSYNKAPLASGIPGSTPDHRYSNLIGSSDTMKSDNGLLRVTFFHCWWAKGTVERMPRIRWGQVHIVNCYFNSLEGKCSIRAGHMADVLIENNYFDGVKNPVDLTDHAYKAVTARGNIFAGSTMNDDTASGIAGKSVSFTPPYVLDIAPAASVTATINRAGATLSNNVCNPNSRLEAVQAGNRKATIFPNPTADYFVANLKAPAKKVTVAAILGGVTQVLENVNTSFTFGNNLSAGVYVLHVEYVNGEKETLRVVKLGK